MHFVAFRRTSGESNRTITSNYGSPDQGGVLAGGIGEALGKYNKSHQSAVQESAAKKSVYSSTATGFNYRPAEHRSKSPRSFHLRPSHIMQKESLLQKKPYVPLLGDNFWKNVVSV